MIEVRICLSDEQFMELALSYNVPPDQDHTVIPKWTKQTFGKEGRLDYCRYCFPENINAIFEFEDEDEAILFKLRHG